MAGLDGLFGPEFAQATPMHTSFLEGAEAHKQGHPRLNPHRFWTGPESAEDVREWYNGWDEAEYSAEYWNNE
jgi:hypothetical protein